MYNHPTSQRRPLGATPSSSFPDPPREGQREYGFSQERSGSLGALSESEMHDADVSGAGSTVASTGSGSVHRDSFSRQVSVGIS
jgi:hypothetical protein